MEKSGKSLLADRRTKEVYPGFCIDGDATVPDSYFFPGVDR